MVDMINQTNHQGNENNSSIISYNFMAQIHMNMFLWIYNMFIASVNI